MKTMFCADKNGRFFGFVEAESKYDADIVARHYKAKIVGNGFVIGCREKT